MSIFHKDFRLFCFSFAFAIWTFLCVLSNMRRHLTTEEAARAVGMLEAGHSQRQVAGQFNVTQSVISRLQNRYNQTGTVQERQRSGRPRCTTAREDRYLCLIARRQKFQSAVRHNAGLYTGSRTTSFYTNNQKQIPRIKFTCLQTNSEANFDAAAENCKATLGNGSCKWATLSLDPCSFHR